MSEPVMVPANGGLVSPYARLVRVAAHAAILCLALILMRDILSADGVRLWPDQGFPLLVVGFSMLTAGPALLRALRLGRVVWGENLVQDLNYVGRVRLIVFGATWIAFAFALPLVGFLVAATLAMATSMTTLGRTKPWLSIPICAVVSFLIFVAFQKVLYVGLPLGPIDLFVIENLLEG